MGEHGKLWIRLIPTDTADYSSSTKPSVDDISNSSTVTYENCWVEFWRRVGTMDTTRESTAGEIFNFSSCQHISPQSQSNSRRHRSCFQTWTLEIVLVRWVHTNRNISGSFRGVWAEQREAGHGDNSAAVSSVSPNRSPGIVQRFSCSILTRAHSGTFFWNFTRRLAGNVLEMFRATCADFSARLKVGHRCIELWINTSVHTHTFTLIHEKHLPHTINVFLTLPRTKLWWEKVIFFIHLISVSLYRSKIKNINIYVMQWV